MSDDGQTTFATVAEDLRRAFDASFALPPDTQARQSLDFLAIRVGSGRYALRVHDLMALEGRRKTTVLPTADSALLGVVGAQGRLVPVYRLGALIGGDGTQEESAWLAICGFDEPVGLAFAALDGHLRVLAADLYQPAKDDHAFVSEAIRLPSEVRYVLDIPAILAAIRDRVGVAALTSGR
jgi:chemotaxis signal transduction protein